MPGHIQFSAQLHHFQAEALRRQIQSTVEAREVQRRREFPLQQDRGGEVDTVVAAQPGRLCQALGG